MRTATFGDRQVIRTLQRDFILLWHNQSPGLNEPGEQAQPTPEQIKAYPEGAGGSNVVTYFADPDGKVVYQLTGFWRPERFRTELTFARHLAGKVKDEKDDKLKEVLLAEYKQQLDVIREERKKLTDAYPEEFKKAVRESEVRKKDAALGLLQNCLDVSPNTAGLPLGTFFQTRSHKGMLK